MKRFLVVFSCIIIVLLVICSFMIWRYDTQTTLFRFSIVPSDANSFTNRLERFILFGDDLWDSYLFDVKENGTIYIIKGGNKSPDDLEKKIYIFPIAGIQIKKINIDKLEELISLSDDIINEEISNGIYAEQPTMCYLYKKGTVKCTEYIEYYIENPRYYENTPYGSFCALAHFFTELIGNA